jgi:phytoene synthase
VTDGLPQSAATIVRTAARAFERDRYLAALLAPSAVREDLLGLAAFAGEIGRIAGYVSEPMIGRIRLQWWREALEQTPATGNPIAEGVRSLIARLPECHAHFAGVIDAREHELDAAFPASDTELDAHLVATEGAMFSLAMRICGDRLPDPGIATGAGRSYGIARTLVELPALLAQRRLLLPRTLLQSNEIPPEALYEGIAVTHPSHPQLMHMTGVLAARARAASVALRGPRGSVSCARIAALLPVALVEPYLALVEQAWSRSGLASARPALDLSPFKRVWTLWRAHRTQRL